MLHMHPLRRTVLFVRAGAAARHGCGGMPLLQGSGEESRPTWPPSAYGLLAVMPCSAAAAGRAGVHCPRGII